MRNRKLQDLNFAKLVHYTDGAPQPASHYAEPLACSGFCVACETHGVDSAGSWRLDQMSHAADTNDYEAILGPLPKSPRVPGGWIREPMMFLLESPGSSFSNGSPVTCRGYTKRPPLNHYYWSPEPGAWPSDERDLAHRYGPYFAYLMRIFALKNVYITNVVKCGKTRRDAEQFEPYSFGSRVRTADNEVLRLCAERFLSRELQFHRPRVVFIFGGSAAKALALTQCETSTTTRLLHPAARVSTRTLVSRNNDRIARALQEAGFPLAV